ncbi:Pentatricopeptide repeat-containing protein [Diplonema papillatum]|nr:Pentatricopeptide repeat-containing protein [Diplonema papillatum]
MRLGCVLYQVARPSAGSVLTKVSGKLLSTDDALASELARRFKVVSGTIEDAKAARDTLGLMQKLITDHASVAGTRTYTQAISVCSRLRSPELGQRLWDEMRRVQIEPNHYSYTNLASCYASVGKVKEVVKLLDEGGYESNAAKGVLLRAYAKAKETDKLMQTFYRFHDLGMKISQRHMVVLMSGQTDPKAAWSLLTTMRSHYEVPPNTLVANAALVSCFNGPDVEMAERILNYMADKGIKKDSSTLSSMCAVYSLNNDLASIERIFQSLEGTFAPNSHMFATYIRCCCNIIRRAADEDEKEKHVQLAEGMLEQAVASGFAHSNLVYTNMLEIYTVCWADERIEKLQNMLKGIGARESSLFRTMLNQYRAMRQNRNAGDAAPIKNEPLQIHAVEQLGRGIERKRAKMRVKEKVSPVFDDLKEQRSVYRGLLHKDMRLNRVEAGDEVLWVREDRKLNRDVPKVWKWAPVDPNRDPLKPPPSSTSASFKSDVPDWDWKERWQKI